MIVTDFFGEFEGKVVDVSLPTIISKDFVDFFSVVIFTGSESFHFLFGDDAIIVGVDEPEEGFGEVLVA